MVTHKGREAYADQARKCYHDQVYPNRELIEVVQPVIDPPPALGELRNVAVRHASGDLWAQWDDDDVHGPERLVAQVNELQTRHAVACFLERETLECICGYRTTTFARRGGDLGYWEHSIVVRRDPILSVLQYPARQVGEDTEFVKRLERMVSPTHLVTLDAPDLYVYRFHGNNVSGARHFDTLFARSGSPHRPSQCLGTT
jgi:glycosyltransferase involved in cell wall biosynthesis